MNFTFEELSNGATMVRPHFSITVFRDGDLYHAVEFMTDDVSHAEDPYTALQRLVLSIGISQGHIPVEDVEVVNYSQPELPL